MIRFFRKSRYAHCPTKTRDTGFKIPKTFAKRREATFEQKLPVSQSQNLFAIIRVPFFKRKAVVIVYFKTCRDGVL